MTKKICIKENYKERVDRDTVKHKFKIKLKVAHILTAPPKPTVLNFRLETSISASAVDIANISINSHSTEI